MRPVRAKKDGGAASPCPAPVLTALRRWPLCSLAADRTVRVASDH